MSVRSAQSRGTSALAPASVGRRIVAGLVDTGAFAVVLVAGVMLLGDPSDPIATADLPAVLAVLLVSLLPEALFGRTLGKLVTATKVLTSTGTKPSFRQIFARRIYGARVLVNLYTLLREGRSRSDRLSRTIVVSTKRA